MIRSSDATVWAFVGLGSNLDVPRRHLEDALDAFDALPDTRMLRCSSFYRTAPVGFAEQPDFINAVAMVETRLTPRELLDALLTIEQEHGRVRREPNGPRTLDLDLLLYGSMVHHEEGLTVPHPRMHERAFVMVPLAEIAPGAEIPGHGAAIMVARELGHDQRVEALAFDAVA